MVHLIVMTQSTPEQRARAEALLASHNNGWQRIGPGVWLLATDVAAGDWRNHLGASLPGAALLVTQLEGQWRAAGLEDVARWLSRATGWF